MESFLTKERRERAIKAATNIAADYGIKSDAPAVLKNSNNTIIHLAPAPVVAKVSTATHRKQGFSKLKHELNIALHLADSGVPIVRPTAEMPPAVYRHEDVEVTFWQYCPGDVREEIDDPELLAALKKFHDALSGYRGALGWFTEDYEECRSLLDGDRLSPELSTTDRQFLLLAYECLSASLQTFDYECVPAHSEIHGGNVMWLGTKPLLIDFENCCIAPREIDFLSFSETNLSAHPELNKQLIEVLGIFKSFCVAVWCWSQPDRAPEVREAAEYHLGRLRGQINTERKNPKARFR
jgi:Ser/Thr protein kinase RdoA (MazF antagonist)